MESSIRDAESGQEEGGCRDSDLVLSLSQLNDHHHNERDRSHALASHGEFENIESLDTPPDI